MNTRPILVGELLFDVLPSGLAVPGGAPFIIAWHLCGFGFHPLLVSALGDDAYGENMRGILEEWGLDTTGIQQSPDYPTGQVQVSLDNGQPTFTVPLPQAYDALDLAAALAAVGNQGALLYHGTLAHRTSPARAFLATFTAALSLPLFVDINLRDPFWDMPFVQTCLSRARWVKLNQHEFEVITGSKATSASIQGVCQEYGLAALLVTLGGDGAVLATPEAVWQGDPVLVTDLADTVGAGDAFTTVLIIGHLMGWDWPTRLRRGIEFSARMCTIPGGTVQNRDLYAEYRHAWGLPNNAHA